MRLLEALQQQGQRGFERDALEAGLCSHLRGMKNPLANAQQGDSQTLFDCPLVRCDCLDVRFKGCAANVFADTDLHRRSFSYQRFVLDWSESETD